MLVSKKIACRAAIEQQISLEPAEFSRLSHILKKYAATRAGLAIDPSLKSSKRSPSKERERLNFILGKFDGLDLSNGMISAQKQGWVKDMYQGQFPEVSKALTASYDTVSLIQYLEHTIEPEKELMAAHNALKKDGILIIEVPNPDFSLFKILGKYWFQWLQPQHLYFFSTENMEKLLEKCGFEPVG